MPVPSVNMIESKQQPVKRSLNTVRISGYAATGLAVASGIAGANKKIKIHKWLAYLAAAFTAWHIGIIEFGHRKRKA